MSLIFKTPRLSISTASVQDIDFIMELEEHPDNSAYVFKGSYNDHLEEISNENILLYIINYGGIPIGFSLSSYDSKNQVFELRRIVISQKDKGYGKEFIQYLMHYAFSTLNVNRFWLDVFDNNHRGIHLYESLDMKLEGILRSTVKTKDGFLNQYVYSILSVEFNFDL